MRRSWEKQPPWFSQPSSHFAGCNPSVSRGQTLSNTFRGRWEGSKVVIKSDTDFTATVSKKSSLNPSFLISAPLQNPDPGFLKNKTPPFDAEATNTALNWLKLEQERQNKATAENRSSPVHFPCKNNCDEVSASGPACSSCTHPTPQQQIRKPAEKQARNSQVMHGRFNASCLKHSLGKIWMYSTAFIFEGPSSSSKNLRRKSMKEKAAAAAWCWSGGSSEHRGHQESLIPVCCHHMAQRHVLKLIWI